MWQAAVEWLCLEGGRVALLRLEAANIPYFFWAIEREVISPLKRMMIAPAHMYVHVSSAHD